MTDNEKAATFIGWEPYVCDDGHCDFCGSRALAHHPAKSPDMSDPRNYMKALGTVVATRKWWGVGIHVESNECWFEYSAMPTRATSQERDIYMDGSSVADAVVKALAALYDAEHKDE